MQASDLKLSTTIPFNSFYRTYLNIFLAGASIDLSPTEKDILEECYKMCNGQFSADGRKIIMERLNMSVGNLNNYIKKLRDKKLVDEENRLIKFLKPSGLIEEGEDQKYVTVSYVLIPKKQIVNNEKSSS